MSDGWIKIYRSIMDDELYFAEKFTRMQAWLDLLLLAEYKPRVLCVRGIKVSLERGQLALSIRELAVRWQWGVNKVQSFLKELAASEKIDTQKSNVVNIVTICKYEKYQIVDDSKNDETDTQTDTQIDTQIDTQTDTQGKKKVTKEKYIEESKENIFPTSPDGAAGSDTQKRSSSKSKKEPTLISKARYAFEAYFRDSFEAEYYWTAKDAKNMKDLLKKICFARASKNMSTDDDSLVEGMKALLDSIGNNFVLENFTVPIINSQYNAIVAHARTAKNKSNGSKRSSNQSGAEQRMQEGAAIVARLLAEDDAKKAAGKS